MARRVVWSPEALADFADITSISSSTTKMQLRMLCGAGKPHRGHRPRIPAPKRGTLKAPALRSPASLKPIRGGEPDYQPPRRGQRTLPSTPRARSLADRLPVPTLLACTLWMLRATTSWSRYPFIHAQPPQKRCGSWLVLSFERTSQETRL